MEHVTASMVRNGVSEPAHLDDLDPCRFRERDFAWIEFVHPSEPELRRIADRLGLPAQTVADALDAHQLPKLDAYGDQLFIVAWAPRRDGGELSYERICIFVGPRFVVTVHQPPTDAIAELHRRSAVPPEGMRLGVDVVLHGVLNASAEAYPPVIDAMRDEVQRVERKVLDETLGLGDIRRIASLRQELAHCARVIAPMLEMSSRLRHLGLPCVKPVLRPAFGQVNERLRRVTVMVEALGEVLRSTFEISILLEQQRQAVVARKLTACAATMLALAVVTSVSGILSASAPEATLRYGCFVLISATVLVCSWLYGRFRRTGRLWSWVGHHPGAVEGAPEPTVSTWPAAVRRDSRS